MSKELASALFMIVLGGFFAVHCSRAALHEYRSGVGVGRHGSYLRGEQPVHFWMTIIGTAAASVMGIFFVAYGVVMLWVLGSVTL